MMRGFRTFALVVAVVSSVVVVRRTWFGVRQADARVEAADPAPRAGRARLDAARRPELPRLGFPDLEDRDREHAGAIVSSDPDNPPHIAALHDLEDGDGLTVEQRWEGTVAELEDRLAPGHGAFHGRVRDRRTDEDLAGVTIIAMSPALQGSQAAISDGQGFFTIGDLPVGDYMLTYYYLESAVERAGLRIEDRQATPAFQSIEQAPPRVFELHIDEDMSDTFEAETNPDVAPDADVEDPGADDSADGLGLSFSSGTSLENHYVIE